MKNIIIAVIVLVSGFTANAQDQSFKEDVQKLMKLIGVEEQINYTREDMIMWTSPVYEKEFAADFDASVPVFRADVEEYYLTQYTHKEIKEILVFYESPVGKKITANNKVLLGLHKNADEKYFDSFSELMYAKKNGDYKK